jgi:Bacteriophage T4-like portal protein (Gp20)
MDFFGLKIERSKKQRGDFKAIKSFVVPTTDDGAIPVEAGGFYGQYVDLDGTVRNDYELVAKYREMSMDPICEIAIDDIINEAIVCEGKEAPVKIFFTSDLKVGDSIKEKIQEEFKNIIRIMQFETRGYEIFRRWYVDGKIYFHVIVDDKKSDRGILELRFVDPLNIQKIREYEKETRPDGTKIITGYRDFYIYNKDNPRAGGNSVGVKINDDAIAFCSSGLFDSRYRRTVGFLHKAIKPLNQLRMMEDAVVIYRISRAPERRIFYIDVGSLPKTKAEQYVKDIMGKYRNKLVYDANTGEMRDDKKFMSMLEDYWLPRREGSKGTEISTLSGAQNLGEMTDVVYFQKKLYKALTVPVSRLEQDKGFQLGRAAEISRDELKFNKFVTRCRNKFGELFYDLLRKQLILKNIIKVDDWASIKECVFFDFLKDSHFIELKNQELRKGMYEELGSVEKYIGKYYSHYWIRTQILGMSEAQIKEMNGQIRDERNKGMYAPDNASFGLQ